jgi:hypothetical protein
MENYRILKLKNGDSVIAGLGPITEKNTIILERPMQFKTMTVMDDRNMGVRDYLLVRNWAEYSTDKNVEIPNDSILAILTPDEKLAMVYEIEKNKEDNPPKIDFMPPMQLTDTPEEEQMQNFQKMNIQLQLPPEASEQFLEMLGIQFDDLEEDDIDDEDLDMDSEIDMEDDVDWEPPKIKPNKLKPAPSSRRDKEIPFGNSPDDWSPDPSDYLK